MKVKNLEVDIKIGNRERKFTNLILNSYLDLFANSIVNFNSKGLTACAINITKNINTINENSTTMNFDTVIVNRAIEETLTENIVINKYKFIEEDVVMMYNPLSYFEGRNIREIGFGTWDYTENSFTMYAYLNVDKYNVVIQKGQSIVISRIDKIESDMKFWSNSNRLKTPYHLTTDAIHDVQEMEYERILPKLHSVGFGILPYWFKDEYLVEDLDIEKTGTGELTINGIESNFAKDDLFPRPDLYPSPNLYPREPTANLLIYKFKMYREIYEDPSLPEATLIDTGLFYVQYKEMSRFGLIDNLKIKYERG